MIDFKYSGRVGPDDQAHAVRQGPVSLVPGDKVGPNEVQLPGGGQVPKYAPTVSDTRDTYNPAQDCDGSFMSYKFQPHNNCYAYACDIATNSFPQPGRAHGVSFAKEFTGDLVQQGAEKDGLIEISKDPLDNDQLNKIKTEKNLPPGHFVALLFSEPDAKVGWPGDYHWARLDKDGTWSQKDGGDAVTNFDFAGNPIKNAATANWVVNQGPISNTDPTDAVVGYKFQSYMYVPDGKVNIV